MSTDPKKWLEAMRGDVLAQARIDTQLAAAVFGRAGSRARGEPAQAWTLAEDVSTFVDAVVADARTADVVPLIASGRSEDDIFEIAVIAAVATGTQRALSGLAALEKA